MATEPYNTYEDLALELEKFGFETELIRPEGPEWLRLEAPAGTMIGVEWLDTDNPETEYAVFLLESDGQTIDEDQPPLLLFYAEADAIEEGLEGLVRRVIQKVIVILE